MIETTNLNGVIVLALKVFTDGRGSFQKTYNQDTLANFEIHTAFAQGNQFRSRDAGTVRAYITRHRRTRRLN